MKTEYNHGNKLGISNIWQDRNEYRWSNRAGEGMATTFNRAVIAAEEALKLSFLSKLAGATRIDQVAHAVACEFSAEDDTPTLHLDLWRGVDLCDMRPAFSRLTIATEGHWDGGRSYSLQIA